MFTVQEISLENFMNIDELVLKFDQNSTVAITGANGAGKSTLFMAIAFCLTGYKRSDTYKEFIKTGEGSSSQNERSSCRRTDFL